MNPQVEASIDRIAGRARDRYENIVSGARSQTADAANRVRKGKDPVRALSKLGIELTSISHKATTNVLKSQTRLIEHQIDALAGRLYAAAGARSVRDLVRGQIRLIPENASRFVEDTRQTLAVVADAGGEVRSVVAGAAAGLRRREPATARTSTRKTAPAKAARKKTGKKKATRKAASKKVARKPAGKTAARAARPAKTSGPAGTA